MLNLSREVPFKNWTKTDFKQKYDGIEYTFEAGQTYRIPADIAAFLAKHLAIRELHEEGGQNNESLPEFKMNEYMKKCFATMEKAPNGVGGFEKIEDEAAPSAPVAPSAPTEEVKNDPEDTTDDSDEDDESKENIDPNADPKFKAAPSATTDGDYVK